jgi:hypothetical protein
MKRKTVAALVAAALLGAGGAWAQNPSQSPGQAGAGTGATQPTQQPHGMGRMGAAGAAALFTPQEHEQFREKMRNAATPEQRSQLRNEYRQLAEQRAKEKGITLSQPRGPRQGDRHMGHPGGRPAVALLTPEERTQMRDKMRSAQTPDQRAELRKEYRALREQRAKEKGINLEERRGPGGRHRDRHGPRSQA